MPKHQATRKPKPPVNGKGQRRHVVNRAPSPSWVSGWRDKIQTSQLIVRLQTFALDDPDNPASIRMTRTQAMVALSLLRKVLPDMQALEISGNSDKPIVVNVLRFSDGPVINADPTSAYNVDQIVDQIEDPPGEPQNPSLGLGRSIQDHDVEGLPPAIENNPRLIEDERSRRRPKS